MAHEGRQGSIRNMCSYSFFTCNNDVETTRNYVRSSNIRASAGQGNDSNCEGSGRARASEKGHVWETKKGA